MITKEKIREMDEAQLRTDVIIPLLSTMGYKDVVAHHGGQLEQGKDVVCWKLDELGCRQNLAIVAKATKITGMVKPAKGSASEVCTQISQILTQLKCQRCISKLCRIGVLSFDTQIPLLEGKLNQGSCEPFPEMFFEAIEDLVEIQKKLKRPIALPLRELTRKEIERIQILRTIFKEGVVKAKWNGFKFEMAREGVQKLLEAT